jgi:hypothetical protein
VRIDLSDAARVLGGLLCEMAVSRAWPHKHVIMCWCMIVKLCFVPPLFRTLETEHLTQHPLYVYAI